MKSLNEDQLLFAEINSKLNNIDHHVEKRHRNYPKILMYRKNHKDPIVYKGKDNLDDIEEWIIAYSTCF
jgi:hypothetical protein